MQSSKDVRRNGCRQFILAAAETVRRVLIDHARKRMASKYESDQRGEQVDFKEILKGDCFEGTRYVELMELDRALNALEREDPDSGNVVKLRFFVGLSNEQVAEQMGVSEKTAQNHWFYAKAWLRDFLQK